MSGIVGIFQRDGGPVDRAVLEILVEAIRFRGPDEQHTWIDGSIGFGHAMLRTTWESGHEHQPLTLDGRTWLVADARIDYRDEISAALNLEERVPQTGLTDAELILRAYERWGEACVEHLLGDFSFAIWDVPERKLFCARDHFGVRPFYYAEMGPAFVFSNDLRCLRQYPGISRELNEQALVDYLAFGHNREPNTTTYAGIQKLPAAHCLRSRARDTSITPYWTLHEGVVRYRNSHEYVDRFRELLIRSVHDRLRTDAVSLFMSGGLDSTAVASLALRGTRDNHATRIKAFTVVEESLGPDPERHYANLAADFLKIPIQFLELTKFGFFPENDAPEFSYSEPDENLFAAARAESLSRVSQFSRVAMEAAGGDVVLLPSHASQKRTGRLFVEMLSSFVRVSLAHRRPARVGFRTAFRPGGPGGHRLDHPLPSFIPPDLANRYDLPQRWRKLLNPDAGGSPRSLARALMLDVSWPCRFEADYAGPGEHHVEMRYPFFDLRLVEFACALPLLPWFVEKHLLRRATNGMLPDSIRLRPKSRVRHNLLKARRETLERSLREFSPSPELSQLLQWNPNPAHGLDWDFFGIWPLLRLVNLDHWMKNVSRFSADPAP